MPLGTPLTTAQRQPRKPVGRPPKLTDEAERSVIAAIRNHQRLEVAAELAGVGFSTVKAWRLRGVEAELFLAEGGKLGDLTALDRRCLEFLAAIRQAEAQAEGVAVRGWLAGGLQPQTTTKTRRKVVGVDAAGQPIWVTETSEEVRPPDASLLIKWLERRVPAYRPTAELDANVEITLRAAGLAERVRAHQDAITAESRES